MATNSAENNKDLAAGDNREIKKTNIEGFYGTGAVREYSEFVQLANKEKVQFPIELSQSVNSKFIDTESKLERSEVSDVLQELGPEIDQNDKEFLTEASKNISNEVKGWNFLITFIRENPNAYKIIDEKRKMRYDEAGSNSLDVGEFFKLKDIPTDGVEKYFLTTFKDVNQFRELTKYGFDVNEVVTSPPGEQTTVMGVELVMKNNTGKREKFVFVFADKVDDGKKVEENEKDEDIEAEGDKTEEPDYEMAA